MLGSSVQMAAVPGVFGDDVPINLGEGNTVQILYETADANANATIFVAPEGDGTDVPAFIFGDASILNADLGWLAGLTEPSLVVVNDAKDAYIRIDAGDDAVAGSKGIYFKAAADEDIELINLSVTGTPRIYWDESENAFRVVSTTFICDGTLTSGFDWYITSRNNDSSYIILGANSGAGATAEVARIQRAANSYFSTGGSQQFKFYTGGTADLNGTVKIGNATEGGTAGLNIKTAQEAVTLTGATTDSTINIPSGSILLGTQFTVNTAVTDSAGDDTWSAAYITGSTTALATAAAAAQNTKVNTLIVPEKASAQTNIRFTPNAGNFSAGVIEIVSYYIDMTSMAN